jgi:hypothetical protein
MTMPDDDGFNPHTLLHSSYLAQLRLPSLGRTELLSRTGLYGPWYWDGMGWQGPRSFDVGNGLWILRLKRFEYYRSVGILVLGY